MKRSAALALLFAGWAGLSAQEVSHDTRKAAAALQVRDGYRLELIASEPLVTDPITARLDGQGRLWVVEMPDYPTGPRDGNAPSGRIKILQDRNADGIYDDATVFAEQLLFATGVQPYRDGAIVTLAGRIVFMRDLDGDCTADETNVWFKGFAEQNQQLRANHPTLGPDGLVYVANGLRGGKVEAVDPRFDPKPNPLDLRDRDFCFDPEGGWWGVVAGKSQFGMTIDDFGRRVGCSNRNPAMMPPLTLDAVDRDPLLAARDAVHNVALAAEQSKVVSRASAWTTSNLHGGQFSAACGVLAAGMEDKSGEWLLACEPTAYLVQRQRLKRDGSVWISRCEDSAGEFLSSSDTWFRPVDATAAAGQSILVVDMARAVIEHPDFVPTELKSRPDQWDGRNLGRIWKVTPLETVDSVERLEGLDQAYQWLTSTSPWQRQIASQTLLESDEADEDRLRAIIRSEDSPRGRARAAWILKRRGWLQLQDAEALAKSSDARLRALAVELSREIEGGRSLAVDLASDSDPLVLRAAAATLSRGTGHVGQRIDGMTIIARRAEDPWTIRTLGAADQSLIKGLAARLAQSEMAQPILLDHLIQRMAIEDPVSAAAVVVKRQETFGAGSTSDLLFDCLEAWIAGTKRGRRSPSQSLQQLDDADRAVLTTTFGAVGRASVDASVPADFRARALAIANDSGHLPTELKPLLSDDSPPQVRVAALPILLRKEPSWTRDYLADRLMGMSIALRAAAVQACSRTSDDTRWLLGTIADGSIPKTVIDPATAKRFRQHSDPEVRKLATSLLRSDPNRVKVLKTYSDSTRQLGDPTLGKKLFVEHCSACHRIDGQGTNVGPDISDTRTKTADALLTSILDPNAAIDASFVQYSVLTLDGRILDGLLIDETTDSVTLQQKGGQRVTIPRQDIDALQAPGVSLMPEGFEQSINVPAMSHLLAYLKNWRYLKTPIPGTLSAPSTSQ